MPSKKRATPVSLQPLDALFGTNEETTNGISEIAIGSLHPFTNHPFQVRDKDVGSIQVELEYLENQGYIRKVAYQADCNHNCNGCHGCDQPTPAAPDVNIWEVIKRTE